ncbi:MAG: cupin domain-containing protein [Desulfobacterales bacterium]|nr:cupin domain-containing protein [Desulfobacterales bacterium]
MAVIKRNETTPEVLGEGRTRYLAHTDNLMMVVVDFKDGPASEPDPPHSHPHEQITHVVSGELLFFLDGNPTRMEPGDMITVPANAPHAVRILTGEARIIDAFTPIREDFLSPSCK